MMHYVLWYRYYLHVIILEQLPVPKEENLFPNILSEFDEAFVKHINKKNPSEETTVKMGQIKNQVSNNQKSILDFMKNKYTLLKIFHNTSNSHCIIGNFMNFT